MRLALLLSAGCAGVECIEHPGGRHCADVWECTDGVSVWWEWDGGSLVEPTAPNALVCATCDASATDGVCDE